MISFQDARKMYDQFEGEAKDMPFMEFYRELNDLTSERKVQEDLAAIQMIMANKAVIDEKINTD